MGGAAAKHSAWTDASPKSPPESSPPSGHCLAPGQDCGLSEEDEYQEFLKNAKASFDRRYKANGCPKAKFEDFALKGLLGQGGFGFVFLVTHRTFDRSLAMKIQSKSDFIDAGILSPIIEKKMQFAMQSAFTVLLLYTFQDSENLYMVLERALYGDVGGKLDPFYRGNEESCRRFAAQMVLGLEYLQSCCILHRDLKPGNILVFADSYIKISDFGLAKQVCQRTSSYLGTLPYMAPELHKSQEYGREVDWWALGLITYRLAYKRHPFLKDGMPLDPFINSVLHDDVTFPEGADPESPMNDFIKQLLEKTRTKRLGTKANRGAPDVKNHPWLSSTDFTRLVRRPLCHIPEPPPGEYDNLSFVEFKTAKELDDYGEWNEF